MNEQEKIITTRIDFENNYRYWCENEDGKVVVYRKEKGKAGRKKKEAMYVNSMM